MSWDEASKEWFRFMSAVEESKRRLHCSNSGAWFRGHTDAMSYKLAPTLFRTPRLIGPEVERELQRLAKTDDGLRRAHADIIQNKDQIEREIYSAHKRSDHKTAEVLVSRLDAIRREKSEVKRQLTESRGKQVALRLLSLGEREAFVEYSFRSEAVVQPSWQILCEMQHHGTPTRLLDWTENLATALFFALRHYRQHVEAHQRSGLEASRGCAPSNGFWLPQVSTVPSVWILNPYRASEKATGRVRVWDFSLEPTYDYFNRFVVERSWPYEEATPMYPPSRHPRILAQQGMFTVFGHDRRPLDEQFGKNVVLEVRVSPMAAVYGVKTLRELVGLDHFQMFRDPDSLSARVRERHLTPHPAIRGG